MTNNPHHFFTHSYRGYTPERGTVRVNVYRHEACPVLFHVVQPEDNQATSITNMAEYIAAEVLDNFLPEALMPNGVVPWVWVESYERKDEKVMEYDATVFEFIELHRTRVYTDSAIPVRIRLGTPHWRRLPVEQFHRMTQGDRKAFDGVPTNNAATPPLKEGQIS
jgi:hypothetical protein